MFRLCARELSNFSFFVIAIDNHIYSYDCDLWGRPLMHTHILHLAAHLLWCFFRTCFQIYNRHVNGLHHPKLPLSLSKIFQ